MMVLLSRWRVTTRVYAGFCSLVLIVLAVAGFGAWQIARTQGQIARMQDVEQRKAELNDALLALETIDRVVLDYRGTRNQAAPGQFVTAHQRVLRMLRGAGQAATSEQRRRESEVLADRVAAFRDMFARLVKATDANAAANQDISVAGASLTVAGAHLQAAAREIDDRTQTDVVRRLEVGLLSLRLTAARFLIIQNDDDANAFRIALPGLNTQLDATGLLADQSLQEQLTEIRGMLGTYAAVFEKLVATGQNARKLFTDDMQPQMTALREGFDLIAGQLSQDYARTQTTTTATLSTIRTMQFAAGAGALLLGVALALLIGRSIARPLAAMTGAMRALAEGDTGIDIPGRDGRDEIASMAKAVQVFRDNGIRARELAARREAERAARDARAARREVLTKAFETRIGELVGALAAAVAELQATAGAMSGTADGTNQQAAAVAAAAEQATANVQTVAAAADQLAGSIAEITRQVGHSSDMAGQAAAEATRTDTMVAALAESAQKIGQIVDLISGIAAQTNLLALNATIEAARAGEAGRGFAVVASEVKSLAGQTSRATQEIGARIRDIQSMTAQAVGAIHAITSTIGELNQVAASIAAAVEQQGAATQEIARNVQQAAAGTSGVTETIAQVSAGANETGAAAGQVLNSAGELSHRADQLRGEVDTYIADQIAI